MCILQCQFSYSWVHVCFRNDIHGFMELADTKFMGSWKFRYSYSWVHVFFVIHIHESRVVVKKQVTKWGPNKLVHIVHVNIQKSDIHSHVPDIHIHEPRIHIHVHIHEVPIHIHIHDFHIHIQIYS